MNKTVNLFVLAGCWECPDDIGVTVVAISSDEKQLIDRLDQIADTQAKEYVTIPIPAMQKILGNGYFMTKLNKQTMKRDQVDITPYLSEANKNVCKEAIDTINGCYNFLQDMSYLVVTGGTGAAWLGYIQNFYKEMDSLKVIDGAANDTIPAIFSNVRGYYMQQLNNLKNKK